MSSETGLALLAMTISLVSVLVAGFFSMRAARTSHQLTMERERRLEEQSALKAAQRVYEPLAQSAAELQSRIFNVVQTGWVALVKRYESHGDYTTASTAFLFAHYFGWIEARRQAVLSSSGEGGRDDAVQALITDVKQTLRGNADSEGFMFYSAEQRAIGEMMFSWEHTTDVEARVPHVMGYATFSIRFRDDADFRAWFAPVDRGLSLVAKGDNRRLMDIHKALVALIRELDPKGKYTPGYSLRAIAVDAGEAPPTSGI